MPRFSLTIAAAWLIASSLLVNAGPIASPDPGNTASSDIATLGGLLQALGAGVIGNGALVYPTGPGSRQRAEGEIFASDTATRIVKKVRSALKEGGIDTDEEDDSEKKSVTYLAKPALIFHRKLLPPPNPLAGHVLPLPGGALLYSPTPTPDGGGANAFNKGGFGNLFAVTPYAPSYTLEDPHAAVIVEEVTDMISFKSSLKKLEDQGQDVDLGGSSSESEEDDYGRKHRAKKVIDMAMLETIDTATSLFNPFTRDDFPFSLFSAQAAAPPAPKKKGGSNDGDEDLAVVKGLKKNGKKTIMRTISPKTTGLSASVGMDGGITIVGSIPTQTPSSTSPITTIVIPANTGGSSSSFSASPQSEPGSSSQTSISEPDFNPPNGAHSGEGDNGQTVGELARIQSSRIGDTVDSSSQSNDSAHSHKVGVSGVRRVAMDIDSDASRTGKDNTSVTSLATEREMNAPTATIGTTNSITAQSDNSFLNDLKSMTQANPDDLSSESSRRHKMHIVRVYQMKKTGKASAGQSDSAASESTSDKPNLRKRGLSDAGDYTFTLANNGILTTFGPTAHHKRRRIASQTHKKKEDTDSDSDSDTDTSRDRQDSDEEKSSPSPSPSSFSSTPAPKSSSADTDSDSDDTSGSDEELSKSRKRRRRAAASSASVASASSISSTAKASLASAQSSILSSIISAVSYASHSSALVSQISQSILSAQNLKNPVATVDSDNESGGTASPDAAGSIIGAGASGGINIIGVGTPLNSLIPGTPAITGLLPSQTTVSSVSVSTTQIIKTTTVSQSTLIYIQSVTSTATVSTKITEADVAPSKSTTTQQFLRVSMTSLLQALSTVTIAADPSVSAAAAAAISASLASSSLSSSLEEKSSTVSEASSSSAWESINIETSSQSPQSPQSSQSSQASSGSNSASEASSSASPSVSPSASASDESSSADISPQIRVEAGNKGENDNDEDEDSDNDGGLGEAEEEAAEGVPEPSNTISANTQITSSSKSMTTEPQSVDWPKTNVAKKASNSKKPEKQKKEKNAADSSDSSSDDSDSDSDDSDSGSEKTGASNKSASKSPKKKKKFEDYSDHDSDEESFSNGDMTEHHPETENDSSDEESVLTTSSSMKPSSTTSQRSKTKASATASKTNSKSSASANDDASTDDDDIESQRAKAIQRLALAGLKQAADEIKKLRQSSEEASLSSASMLSTRDGSSLTRGIDVEAPAKSPAAETTTRGSDSDDDIDQASQSEKSESKESKDTKENKESKEPKEAKETKEAKESKESKGSKDVKDGKSDKESTESTESPAGSSSQVKSDNEKEDSDDNGESATTEKRKNTPRQSMNINNGDEGAREEDSELKAESEAALKAEYEAASEFAQQAIELTITRVETMTEYAPSGTLGASELVTDIVTEVEEIRIDSAWDEISEGSDGIRELIHTVVNSDGATLQLITKFTPVRPREEAPQSSTASNPNASDGESDNEYPGNKERGPSPTKSTLDEEEYLLESDIATKAKGVQRVESDPEDEGELDIDYADGDKDLNNDDEDSGVRGESKIPDTEEVKANQERAINIGLGNYHRHV